MKAAAVIVYLQSAVAIVFGLWILVIVPLAGLLVIGLVILQIWVAMKMKQGRNWARFTIAILSAVAVLYSLKDLDVYAVVGIVLLLVVVGLMFTRPANTYFRRSEEDRQRLKL